MISREKFAYWCGVLSERFNRQLSAPTYGEYFAALTDAQLTDDELDRAMRHVFRCSVYWPSPKEIVAVVRPELSANTLFYRLTSRATGAGPAGPYWEKNDIIKRFGERAYTAFVAIGGNDRLRALTSQNENYVRRDFEREFNAAEHVGNGELAPASEPRYLGAATIDQGVPA